MPSRRAAHLSSYHPGGKTDLFYDPPQTRGSIGDLTGPALVDDRAIHLSDFAGKVVLVNIRGSWCAPCRTETPELEKVFDETEALGGGHSWHRCA